MLRILLLTFCAYTIFQAYFGPKTKQQAGRPDQKAPALSLAFAGIGPTQDTAGTASAPNGVTTGKAPATSASSNGVASNSAVERNAAIDNAAAGKAPVNAPAGNAAGNTASGNTASGELEVGPAPSPNMPTLNAQTGAAEILVLDKVISGNERDEYSYWARLRKGLIQQYVLGELQMKPRQRGPFEWITGIFWPQPSQVSVYDDIINHMGANGVTAQASYQKGDLLWRQAMVKGGPPTRDASMALEQLIHRGRSSSAFLDTVIYVPLNENVAPQGLEAARAGFRSVQVRQLHSIPERVNAYYSTTTFYKIVDVVVHAFGNNPAFSYGLAILFFAVLTRLALQPIMKKQYESMKGMQVIAPEMKKIQEKYKGKTEQQAQMVQEIRALQANHGVNPMMGCGLALVQIPFFIFVVYPMIQHYESKMELVSASFLWIANLARPDLALLIMYAFSMFLSMRLSSTPPTDPQQAQMQTMMTFFMPVTIPFFLHGYPSAFTMFWMVYNFVSTVLQYRMMKAANPNKSVIKALMGQTPASADAQVVPSRPKSSNKPVVTKSLTPGPAPSQKGENGLNGSLKTRSNNGATTTNGAFDSGNAMSGSAGSGKTNGSANRSAHATRSLDDAEIEDSADDVVTSDGATFTNNGGDVNGTNGTAANGSDAKNGSSRSARRARQRRRH
ncbi:MAG TPA: YidC/Oxa1 family membrane protein insertase [Abditibacteriaceae bacterium]